MAIETFIWAPDDEATSAGSFRRRQIQFGNGYSQVAGDGLNGEDQPWSLSFGGLEDEIAEPLAFIRRQGGVKAFLWTPPGGDLGLYLCPSYNLSKKPNGVTTLSLTFERAYRP